MSRIGRYIGTTARGLTKNFSVPVPWGCVAGKTWGDNANPPVLCLHGWLDNCNTFDKLIPLLPKDNFYIALDTPGHGLSSHFPTGMFYFTIAYCGVLKRVIDHFKLKELSIIGHSMGGNIGAHFSGLYPEVVKRLVIIDSIGTWFRMKEDLVVSLRSCIDSHLAFEKAEERPEKQYTYEQAKERLKIANKGLDDEGVEILLERGMKELDNGQFTFRRDLRHLFKDAMERTIDSALAVTENISADVLIVGADSSITSAVRERFKNEIDRIMGTFEKSCKSFRVVKAKGNHHLHLCTPDETAAFITEFFADHPREQQVDANSNSNL